MDYSIGIQNRSQRSDDEVPRLGCLAGLRPEPVLQGGEETDPAAELHEGPPSNCRQVQPHELGPFDEQEPAQEYEAHEGAMKEQHEISAYAIERGVGSEENGQVAQPARWKRRGVVSGAGEWIDSWS